MMKRVEGEAVHINENIKVDKDENDSEDEDNGRIAMEISANTTIERDDDDDDDDDEFHGGDRNGSNLRLVSWWDHGRMVDNLRTDWRSCLMVLALDVGTSLLLPYLWSSRCRSSLFGFRGLIGASSSSSGSGSACSNGKPQSNQCNPGDHEDDLEQDELEYYKAVGLKNYGETCFLNAVLQALAAFAHDDDFSLFLLTSNATIPTPAPVNNNRKPLLVGPALYDILHRINHRPLHTDHHPCSTHTHVDPRWLLRSCQWTCHQAQDAHELFLFIMELLISSSPSSSTSSSNASISSLSSHSPHNSYDHHHQQFEEKKYSDSMFDTITNSSNTHHNHNHTTHTNTHHNDTNTPFTGKFKTTLICTACNHVRTLPMEESFVQLSLPIIIPTNKTNNNTTKTHTTTLHTCLQYHINQQERIPQVECYQCQYKHQLQYYEQEKQLYEQALQRLKQKTYHHNQQQQQQQQQQHLSSKQVTNKMLPNNTNDTNAPIHNGNSHFYEDDYCEMKQEYQQILSKCQYYKKRLLQPQATTNSSNSTHEHNNITIKLDDNHDADLKPKYRDAWKCVQMTHVPHLLCLHMKRLVGIHQPKISTHVEFPFILNFASTQFECVSVIEHLGTPQRGHYVNYRQLHTSASNCNSYHKIKKNFSNKSKWARISDNQIIQPIPWKQVSQCEAYMIFYKQIIT